MLVPAHACHCRIGQGPQPEGTAVGRHPPHQRHGARRPVRHAGIHARRGVRAGRACGCWTCTPGTGALGIEALSRGAAWCDFVEEDRATCRIIAENLAHTRLAGRGRVHCHTVERVVGHPEMLGARRPGGAGAGPNPPAPFPAAGRGRGTPPPLPAVGERRAGEERGPARAADAVQQGDAGTESSPPDHCTAAPGYDIILLDPPYALAERRRPAASGTVLARLAGEGLRGPGRAGGAGALPRGRRRRRPSGR